MIRLHGSRIGAVSFQAPYSHCPTCKRKLKKKGAGTQARLYTLSRGVLPVVVHHATCVRCEMVYYPSYQVHQASRHDSQRQFYTSTPEYIPVLDTVYMDRPLMLFLESQLVQTISASKIATTYNVALAVLDGIPETEQDLKPRLTPDMIYEAFFVNALLRHHDRVGTTLSLPHRGNQSDRLTAALQARNQLMVGTGQEMWAHACKGCMRLYHGEDGNIYRLRGGGTDGVTVKRPCCSVDGICTVDLTSPKDRFCPEHAHKRHQCFVINCDAPARPDCFSCSANSHMQREIDLREQHQKGHRELSQRAYRAGLAKTYLAGRTSDHCLPEESQPPPPDEPNIDVPTPPPVKGSWSRKFTHNEQLFVLSCGIIVARATMFQAEGVASVKDFLKAVFPQQYPGALPQLMFFDKACQLLKHLHAQDDHYFDKCGLHVDVFHASSKHHERDHFCNIHCNPALFAEMRLDPDKWSFNTSVCEKENNWFGGLEMLVKMMASWRYSFFLDEMIMLHNQKTTVELEKRGWQPHIIPDYELRAPH
ncbi:hypothetical protein C8J56DRAFT_940606 [Mycena floridula]|nr:hypothetical protein C8J56DRAFT_940606 [Mycena floridula]